MATQFPASYSTFGLAQETGIVTDSITWAYSQDSKEIRDADGDIAAKAYYNERIEVSIAGFLPTATPFTTTLAAAITIVTAPTDHLIAASLGSLYLCESINITQSNEEYRRIDVTAMNYPIVTAT